MKTYQRISGWVHKLSTVLVWISGILLALMALLIFVDVIGRYILNAPIKGSQEIVQMMIVVILYFGLGYSTYARAHIRVDILINAYPKFIKEFVLGVTELIACSFSILMCVQMFRQGVKIMNKGTVTDILGLKYFPFYFISSFGCLSLTVEFLLDAVRFFLESHQTRLARRAAATETEAEA